MVGGWRFDAECSIKTLKRTRRAQNYLMTMPPALLPMPSAFFQLLAADRRKSSIDIYYGPAQSARRPPVCMTEGSRPEEGKKRKANRPSPGLRQERPPHLGVGGSLQYIYRYRPAHSPRASHPGCPSDRRTPSASSANSIARWKREFLPKSEECTPTCCRNDGRAAHIE